MSYVFEKKLEDKNTSQLGIRNNIQTTFFPRKVVCHFSNKRYYQLSYPPNNCIYLKI